MPWTDYSTAPDAGTLICDPAEIGRVVTISLRTEKGNFPMLVVRCGGGFRAYVNACPHQYLPLDHNGSQVLSADGAKLLCTVHGARFDMATGQAIDGADCGLDPVPVAVIDGVLTVGSAERCDFAPDA